MLGVVCISKIWPKETAEGFIDVTFSLNRRQVTCKMCDSLPLIGLHQDLAFPPEESGWNRSLVKKMASLLLGANSEVNRLFMALHDLHYLGEHINKLEEHHYNIHEDLDITQVNSSIGVVFQHVDGSRVFGCLSQRMKYYGTIDASGLYDDLLDLFGELDLSSTSNRAVDNIVCFKSLRHQCNAYEETISYFFKSLIDGKRLNKETVQIFLKNIHLSRIDAIALDFEALVKDNFPINKSYGRIKELIELIQREVSLMHKNDLNSESVIKRIETLLDSIKEINGLLAAIREDMSR